METGSSEGSRDGCIVLEASCATASSDGKEYPKEDGGGCKTDENKDTGDSPCV